MQVPDEGGVLSPHAESAFWVFAVRVFFGFFIWHSALLVAGLLQLHAKTAAAAELTFSGLLFVKLPLLLIVSILSILIPNADMANFQYAVYTAAAPATIILAVLMQLLAPDLRISQSLAIAGNMKKYAICITLTALGAAAIVDIWV